MYSFISQNKLEIFFDIFTCLVLPQFPSIISCFCYGFSLLYYRLSKNIETPALFKGKTPKSDQKFQEHGTGTPVMSFTAMWHGAESIFASEACFGLVRFSRRNPQLSPLASVRPTGSILEEKKETGAYCSICRLSPDTLLLSLLHIACPSLHVSNCLHSRSLSQFHQNTNFYTLVRWEKGSCQFALSKNLLHLFSPTQSHLLRYLSLQFSGIDRAQQCAFS